MDFAILNPFDIAVLKFKFKTKDLEIKALRGLCIVEAGYIVSQAYTIYKLEGKITTAERIANEVEEKEISEDKET